MSVMVIPEFGVSAPLQLGENTFTFTPDKTGQFDVVCPMGIKETTMNVID
jgi:plastocyanin domain-containing protein